MDDPRRSSTKPDDGWFSKFTFISIERNENHKGQYQVIIARSTFFSLDDFGTTKNFFPTTPGEALLRRRIQLDNKSATRNTRGMPFGT